jgi:hypothetical protein
MTATTSSATVRPSTVFSTEKKKGGAYVLDATCLTALGALGATATASDALDLLSANQKRAHVVSANQIGKASSVEN